MGQMPETLRAEVTRNLPIAAVGARARSEHSGQSVISNGHFGSHHAQLLELGERWPVPLPGAGHGNFHSPQTFEPWRKGKLVGQKAPLKLKDIWAFRIRIQLGHKIRDLALFNLALDSKLRACDLVNIRVCDVSHGGQIASRAIVMQQKTG